MSFSSDAGFVIDPLEPRLLLSGRVIGYFPEYRYASHYTKVDFGSVTHVNYFSVFASANGSLNTGSPYANMGHLDTLVSMAHGKRIIWMGSTWTGNRFGERLHTLT
jgi:hypothetical protein